MALRKQLAAIATAILMLPISAKAQINDNFDMQSYTYGYILGSALTTCEWLESGRLSRSEAKDWLTALFGKFDDVPRLAQEKALAYARQNKKYDYCPLPR